MFASALLSGLAFGGEAESGPVLNLHIGSVVLIGIGIAVALVFGNTRAVLRSARDLPDLRPEGRVLRPQHDRASLAPESRPLGEVHVGQKVLAWSLVAALSP